MLFKNLAPHPLQLFHSKCCNIERYLKFGVQNRDLGCFWVKYERKEFSVHSCYYMVLHKALKLYTKDVRPEKNSLSSKAGVST